MQKRVILFYITDLDHSLSQFVLIMDKDVVPGIHFKIEPVFKLIGVGRVYRVFAQPIPTVHHPICNEITSQQFVAAFLC